MMIFSLYNGGDQSIASAWEKWGASLVAKPGFLVIICESIAIPSPISDPCV
jgi:hypothetical protein